MGTKLSSNLNSTRVKGILCALTATIVWSSNFVLGKDLVKSLPPITLSFSRWFLASIFILPFAIKPILKDRKKILNHKIYYLFASFTGVSIFNATLYAASETTAAINISLIAITSPMFTILFAYIIYKEPISLLRLFGIFLIVCGCFVLFTKGDLSKLKNMTFAKGDLLALTGSISFSIYTLIRRNQPKEVSSIASLATSFIIGTMFLIPALIWELYDYPILSITTATFTKIAYLAVGPSILCFWVWGKAVELIGPTQSSIIYYTLPLFSTIGAIIYLNEYILAFHCISASLIITGLLLSSYAYKKPIFKKIS